MPAFTTGKLTTAKPAPRAPDPSRAAALDPSRPRHYDLFCADGGQKARLQLTDEGVQPGPDALEYMLERRWIAASYDEIVSVTLTSTAPRDSATIAVCRIEFDDGGELLITSAGANSLSDGMRNRDFGYFLRDLHARLRLSGDAARIIFRAGVSPRRRRIVLGALLAGAGLFVGLPIALFEVTRYALLLPVTLVGVALMLLAVLLVGPSRPRAYRPEAPPDPFR